MDLARVLSYNFVFRGVPRSVMALIAATADVRDYRGGETLVRQFDHSQDILVILEGQAVTRNFSGEVLATFGPGSIIGEMALIDGEARCATVTTVGPTKVAILQATCIKAVIDSDPELAGIVYQNLAKVLCRRLRSMNERAGLMAHVA